MASGITQREELAKHCTSKNWSKAIRVLDSLLSHSSNIQDICNRAFCYSQLELHKHVIKDCDKALQLDPTLLQAYILKGRSFSALGKKGDALLVCEQGYECSLNQASDLKQLLELEELLTAVKQSVSSSVENPTTPSSQSSLQQSEAGSVSSGVTIETGNNQDKQVCATINKEDSESSVSSKIHNEPNGRLCLQNGSSDESMENGKVDVQQNDLCNGQSNGIHNGQTNGTRCEPDRVGDESELRKKSSDTINKPSAICIKPSDVSKVRMKPSDKSNRSNGLNDEVKKNRRTSIPSASRTTSISVDFRLSRGIAAVNEGKYAQAVAIFDQILKGDPTYPEALIGRGTAYAFKRELDAAIADFTNAIQLNPSAGEAWKRRGQARAALGESALAISDLTQALEFESNSVDILYERGIVNFKFKDYDAAIGDLSECVKLGHDNKSAYTFLGSALTSVGQFKNAEVAHMKAIQLDPNYLEAWAHLIQVWNKLKGEYEGSERVKAVRLLTLKREFELMKMKDSESIKEYSGRLMDNVNQIRLLGELFTEQKVCEKIMVSIPQRFEAKISAIEETTDLESLSIAELTSKLYAQEQRATMRNEEVLEGAFQANAQSVGSKNQHDKKVFSKFKGKHDLKKGSFQICGHCKKTNHAEKDCWFKDKPVYRCVFCNKVGHSEKFCRLKKKQSSQNFQQQAKVSEEEKESNEHLFRVSRALNQNDPSVWLIDSGCTSHMAKDLFFFTKMDNTDQPKVKLGNGETVQARGRGTILFHTKRGTKSIQNVLYIPELDQNLLSVAQMLKNGYTVSFKDDFCHIYDTKGAQIANIKMQENSFYLDISSATGHVLSAKEDESETWHKRFGHYNLKSLKYLSDSHMVVDMPEISTHTQICSSCALGKQNRKPFPKSASRRATKAIELIHSDICGPMSTESLGRNLYFVLFIDDYTRMTRVYFLRHKSEVFTVFTSFKQMVEVQTGLKIKALRTDNGGEFTSNEFNIFCTNNGIVHQLTVPYTPQQNGVSERKNRTVMEMARCMLFEMKMPKFLWAEAVNTSVYLLNRLSTRSVEGMTPIEAWSGQKPSVKHLKIFGSLCYFHVPFPKRSKLDEKSECGIFLGYSSESKGYRIYSLKDCKIVISRDVICDEKSYWDWDLKHVCKCKGNMGNTSSATDEVTTFDVEGTTDTPVLRTKSLTDVYESCRFTSEPTCYFEAAKQQEWVDAMNAELNAIERNQTWELTELPENKKAIGVKWVFRTKFNSDGSIYKHKARLVVKGYSQIPGIDYFETFAPVARHDTIKLLLALAGQLGWQVFHLDVKSAFLNGTISEDIYVQQPDGFEVKGKENKVLKLHKALYGLKQAPRAWYSKIDSHLCKLGFRRSENEPTLYLKQDKTGLQLVVSLYVDDMFVTGSNATFVTEFKKEMENLFEMSDLGVMKYFLGIEILQCKKGIFISQKKYSNDILKRFKFDSCKEVPTPLILNDKISKEAGIKLDDPSVFRSLVGSLLYLTETRPDLMFSAGLLSRYMSSPADVHMGIAKRVLRYLRGTIGAGIWYERTGFVKLQGYADSDWAGCVDDMKSTSGYVFNLGSGAICWNAKKQEVVAQSTAEAEYISLSAAANQAVWLHKLLADLGQEQISPTEIFCDNKSAIAIAENPVQHKRSKHIKVKYHSIRNMVKESLIKLHYCPTDEQVADLMTKGVPKAKLEYFKTRLGMAEANLKEEC